MFGIALWYVLPSLLPWGAGDWLASSLIGGGRWQAGETLMERASPNRFDRMVQTLQCLRRTADRDVRGCARGGRGCQAAGDAAAALSEDSRLDYSQIGTGPPARTTLRVVTWMLGSPQHDGGNHGRKPAFSDGWRGGFVNVSYQRLKVPTLPRHGRRRPAMTGRWVEYVRYSGAAGIRRGDHGATVSNTQLLCRRRHERASHAFSFQSRHPRSVGLPPVSPPGAGDALAGVDVHHPAEGGCGPIAE